MKSRAYILNPSLTQKEIPAMKSRAYILNIGLNPSRKFPERSPITSEEIRATIANTYGPGAYIRSYEEAQSATEQTAVIRLTLESDTCNHEAAAYFTALNLSQDCIAVVSADIVECNPRHRPDQSLDGALIGPHAAAWGVFNASYFLLPANTPSDAYAGHLPGCMRANTPSDAYAGHLPGSGVQRHSADALFANHGVHLRAIESANGRRLWQAIDRTGKVIAAHPRHSGCSFIATALLTGA